MVSIYVSVEIQHNRVYATLLRGLPANCVEAVLRRLRSEFNCNGSLFYDDTISLANATPLVLKLQGDQRVRLAAALPDYAITSDAELTRERYG